MTADGKVLLKICDVKTVNDVEGKVPEDDQVGDVHDAFLIVLVFEVAIFDVVFSFIDVYVAPICRSIFTRCRRVCLAGF